MAQNKDSLIIYGGSFNPPHIGHLRLAIETFAVFRQRAAGLAFMPSYHPPHKEASSLLPFALRVAMIKAVIAGFPDLHCCEIESALPEPSFTYDILEKFREDRRIDSLYFLLGSQDFCLLHTWKEGLRLPALCSLIVAPRGDFGYSEFLAQCRAYWPEGDAVETGLPASCFGKTAAFAAPCQKPVYFENIPYLEISSSRIRKLWLHGLNVDYLTPPEILRLLNENSGIICDVWQENDNKC